MSDAVELSSKLAEIIRQALLVETRGRQRSAFSRRAGLSRWAIRCVEAADWNPSLRTICQIIASLPAESRACVLRRIRALLDDLQAAGPEKSRCPPEEAGESAAPAGAGYPAAA